MPRKLTAKTQKQLLTENEDLRARLDEAEATLNAIRNGEVDALVVSGIHGDQVFTFKQVEEALQVSEEKYRKLVEEVNDGFYIADKAGGFTFANPALARIYGVDNPEALVGRQFMDFIAPEILEEMGEATQNTMYTGHAPEIINGQIVRPDGTRIFIEIKPVSILKGDQIIGSQGVVRDVTERKLAEARLAESETKLRALFDGAGYAIGMAKAGTQIMVNQAYLDLFGYRSVSEVVGNSLFDDLAPAERTRAQSFALRRSKGEPVSNQYETCGIRRDGTIFDMDVRVSTYMIGVETYTIGIMRDITERKHFVDRIQRQLEHLTALSGIDRLISSNFDLQLSLSEILAHVTAELAIDAADILIFNPAMQMLEYGARRGFRTNSIRKAPIRLGESFAGRAALERQLVQIPDLKADPHSSSMAILLAGEDFVCYFGVPLIIKGQVKGVLEIFHRAVLEPDTEWFDFLNTLAGQAAIAVEIATLFESLQRSNADLFLAYDATIAGWSQALDLRDKETEGHSKRVTEQAVKLASLFGLSDSDLVQVRWGALLHDIGKMGISDGILLKAGPLTDKEWVAMKQHPSFAYELLAPIGYLRLALDIPYYHHEKWDGTGYPKGLKGAQIPLVARIFAVVDVWDALNSDRPYRAAWPKEKVCDYICSMAGTHFDPHVVDMFMQILD